MITYGNFSVSIFLKFIIIIFFDRRVYPYKTNVGL